LTLYRCAQHCFLFSTFFRDRS